MRRHTLTGNIHCHRQFPSRTLGNRRDILVYLPPGYRRFLRRRYPVLYLQDGQNLFDAATAFAGVEWGVDETAQRLIRRKLIEPTIIVAIANTGPDRIHEYAPTRGIIDSKAKRKKRSRGLARKYGKFLIQELKPLIDSKYRTKPEAEFTGLGGASLGGLLVMTLGLWFPNVFSRLAVMSPSVWWDDEVIVRGVQALDKKLPLRSEVREIFDPGIKAIDRFEISDKAGSRIYRPWRGIARWSPRDDAWALVSKCLLAPGGNVAVGLVGR